MRDVYRSATFDTKMAAKEWAAAVEVEIRSGKQQAASEGVAQDAFDRYAEEVSPTKKGVRWEVLRLGKLRSDPLGAVRLDRLSPADVAAFRDRRLAEVSPGTVNRELNLISSVFETATCEWKWLPANPCRGIRRPRNPRARDRRVSSEEVRRVCLALGYSGEGPVANSSQQTALAFLIALETAMRQAEIVSLQWDDVNMAGRFCTLRDSKNGDKRHVPLNREALRLFGRREGYAVPFTVNPATASALFRRARVAAGIDDLRFHDSRHEAITRLAQRLSILDLARMVGHRDLKSLQIYYNPTATQIAERLDD